MAVTPKIMTEGEALTAYLADQLKGIRNAAYGLTEEQARETPTKSALSVAGIIKHMNYVMSGVVNMDRGADKAAGGEIDWEEAGKVFAESFALRADETLEGTLQKFDELRDRYLALCAQADPDADTMAGPAPWDGIDQPMPVKMRHNMLHHVEEIARHAGHADIIRECIDGATAMPLAMAVDGRPGNAFGEPWQPAQ